MLLGKKVDLRCCFCNNDLEFVAHNLIHCKWTIGLWLWASLFGVDWVFPHLVINDLLSWHNSFVGTKQRLFGGCGFIVYLLGYIRRVQ